MVLTSPFARRVIYSADMGVTSWSAARRFFLVGAVTVMSVHFTIIYLFIQEQLAANGSKSPSRGRSGPLPALNGYGEFLDERSPLETDAGDTDWGSDFRDPTLLHRHLVAHRGDFGESMREERAKGRRKGGTGSSVGTSSYMAGAVGVGAGAAALGMGAGGALVLGVGVGGTGNDSSSDACLGLNLLEEDFDEPLEWQDVVPGSAAVFSAYLDTAPGGGVRPDRLVVVGVAGPGVLEEMRFECQVWYRHPGDTINSWVVRATAVRLQEGSEGTGGDVFFYCPANADKDPLAVSIVNRKRCAHSPPNLLLIRNIDESQARTRPVNNFTVCIAPLRNRFNDTSALVETLELNMLLGASRIALYDEDTTGAVKDFYNSYKHEDTATVIPWKLPNIKMNRDDRSGSNLVELSALNDCLYRFRFSSRYIVFVGIEEFILPEVVTNWNDLMLKVNNKRGFSVFEFRRVLFEFRAKNPEQELSGKQFRLVSQLKKGRLRTLPIGVRQRYVVSPTRVDMVGVYGVISRRKGETLQVGDADAGVHDYNDRRQEANSGVILSEDTRAQIYHKALFRKVMKRYALVRGKE